MIDGPLQRLLLVSRRAFYPNHFSTLREICRRYRIAGAVIGSAEADVPSVHRQLGWISPDEARAEGIDVGVLPDAPWTEQRAWLHAQLDDLAPTAIWLQEEPTDLLALEVLAHYRRTRGPAIAGAVCENIFTSGGWRMDRHRRRMWPRLDALLPVAGPSIEGIRTIGMPRSIGGPSLVAGIEPPPPAVEPLELGLDGRFVVGFVGRIVPEKGWRTLVDAVASLDDSVALVLAGDGPDDAALASALATPGLAGRAKHLGLLGRAELWHLYAALDCLAVPSRTTPSWMEQAGIVLAEAMALGVPVIGSSSGGIPEVVGDAGTIVPEGDAPELAAAIEQLRVDPELRARLGAAGSRRYEDEFSIPAYARKIAEALRLPQ